MRLEKLEKDIHNCVHHVFGDHRNCTDFCKVKNEKQYTATNDPNTAVEDCRTEENILDVIERVMNIWRDTVDLDKEEESRGNWHIADTLDALMIRGISLLLNRVAAKSSRLIGNYTTNLAES
ncbi:hypothetical protein KUTeg_017867 [Tegillarca granosa]|uniref:Uncharacterized protein n=1 Tax=Tegillarca granosa TaxID=220873 RepID=A0ABQ9EG56_TEGGR|nr:hypothetical protein KUTeg_017867 [Tegillarca granosa]